MLVDADTHLNITLEDLVPFMDQPWRLQVERAPRSLEPRDIGEVTVGGRIKRPLKQRPNDTESPINADISILFPNQLLSFGLMPNLFVEVAVAVAYSRWITQAYLPNHPEARAMLYLPIRDPDACQKILADYGDHPGVVGAFITSAGFPQVHDNRYVHLYSDLQERDLALGFHPTSIWLERPMEIFDRYLAVYALGYPFSQCVHLINWVMHGMPERFPQLRCVFCESGIAWLSFISHRLDQEFMKRPSEAPALKDRPSHYISRYFYTTQPLDLAEETYLESVIRQVGSDQFVYASNFPQWDFDVPGVIDRLTFLDNKERSNIMGNNAVRLFRQLSNL